MKRTGLVLLGVLTALTVNAQDPAEMPAADPAMAQSAESMPADAAPPVEVVPVEEAAPEVAAPEEATADGAATDTAATDTSAPDTAAPDTAAPDTAAPAEFAETPADVPAEATAETVDASYEAPVTEETVPVEEAASEPSEPAAESKPWMFYAGADVGRAKVSVSKINGFPNEDLESDMLRGRFGVRLTEDIGLEAHFGKGKDDAEDGEMRAHLDTYYGIYIVPTGTFLELVEIAFPLGYAMTKIESDDKSEDLHSASYGLNIEFPLRVFSEGLPNIRIGGGGMVYHQTKDARVYGFHAGLRFDFGG